MKDHTLHIVVHRTMETGRWVAKISVDDKRKETTLTFYQRKKNFSLSRWFSDKKAGMVSAPDLSKKYLKTMNFEPDHLFGNRNGFLHIRKPVDQAAIDRKLVQVSVTLRNGQNANGPVGAPFARRTEDFNNITVAVHDSFMTAQDREKVSSLILSEVTKSGEPMPRGTIAYYQALLNLAYDVSQTKRIPPGQTSDVESALCVLNGFKEKLAAAPDAPAFTQVDQLLKSLQQVLLPRSNPADVPVVYQPLSALNVYGRKPIKPEALLATKKQNPRAVKREG